MKVHTWNTFGTPTSLVYRVIYTTYTRKVTALKDELTEKTVLWNGKIIIVQKKYFDKGIIPHVSLG